jgi:hypothetical protein
MNDIDELVELYEQLIRESELEVLATRDVRHMLETKSFFYSPIPSGSAERLNEYLKRIAQQIPSEQRLLFEQRIAERLAEVVKDFKINEEHRRNVRSEVAQALPLRLIVVQEMIEQLSRLDQRQLEAGLGVILRDTLQYSLEHEVDGVTFKTITSFVIVEEEIEGVAEHHRLLFLDPEALIPKGLIVAMLAGDFDCSLLKDPSIQHEWTIHPARRFLRKFDQRHKEFRDSICASDCLNGKLKNNFVSYKESALAIARAGVSAGFSESVVWSPLVSYLGLLITTTIVDVDCDD